MKNRILLSVAMGLTITAVGCGPGFKSGLGDAAGKTNCETNCENPPADPWSMIDLKGEIAGGAYGNDGSTQSLSTTEVDRETKNLSLRIPLRVNPFGADFKTDVPELPGTSFSISKDARGRWILALDIPLKYVIRDIPTFPAEKLPNGDPLPGIAGGGELPKLGLRLGGTKAEVDLYIGANAVGVFIPTPGFNPYVNLSYQIRNKARTPVGFFATVAKKDPYEGGFYASVVIPDEMARMIDSVL